MRYLRTSYRCDPHTLKYFSVWLPQVKDTLSYMIATSPPNQEMMSLRQDVPIQHISLVNLPNVPTMFLSSFSGLRPVQKHMFPLAVRCLHFLSIWIISSIFPYLSWSWQFIKSTDFSLSFSSISSCVDSGHAFWQERHKNEAELFLGAFPQGLIMLTLCSTGWTLHCLVKVVFARLLCCKLTSPHLWLTCFSWGDSLSSCHLIPHQMSAQPSICGCLWQGPL